MPDSCLTCWSPSRNKPKRACPGWNQIIGRTLAAAVAVPAAVTVAVVTTIMLAAMLMNMAVMVTTLVTEIMVVVMVLVMWLVAVVAVSALVRVTTASAATEFVLTVLVAVYCPASFSLLVAVMSVSAATALAAMITTVLVQFLRPLLGLQLFSIFRFASLSPLQQLLLWLTPHLCLSLVWRTQHFLKRTLFRYLVEFLPRGQEFFHLANQHDAEATIGKWSNAASPHRLQGKPKSQECSNVFLLEHGNYFQVACVAFA